jgi:tetratricopeptide (TPR) repeat protein/CHAT domain-containing protein
LEKVKDQKNAEMVCNNLAMVYNGLGQTSKAVEYYEKSLEICRKVGDVRGEGQTLNNLGVLYDGWGQYQKAVEYYEKALEIKRKVGDIRGEGITLSNLGNVYSNWGQYQKAIDLYEKSLEIARKIQNPKSEGNALNNLGIVYKNWGQYQKAVEYYEKSLQIYRKVGDIRGEGRTFDNLGNVYSHWGQYQKAVEYYEKSLGIGKKMGDIAGEGSTLNNLGIVYMYWGQYQKAVEHYEKSLDAKRKVGDIRGEGANLNNLGIVFSDWGQYQKAVEYYEKSLEIKRKVGDIHGEGQTLNNLANVFQDWGQYQKAVEYYEKSLEIKRNVGDVSGEGHTLNNLANVFQAWGQYQKAAEHYEKALEIAREAGDIKGQGQTLMNVGRLHVQRREYKEALANIEKSLETYARIGVPTRWPKKLIGDLHLDMGDPDRAEPLLKEAGYHSSLGRLHLTKSDYAGAKQYYDKLLDYAEKSRDADNLFAGYTGLGMAFEGLKEDPKAAGHFKKAIELTEELRSNLSRSERETFFDVRINGFYRTAPYEGLARTLMRMNQPMEAYKGSEYTKARVFAEALSRGAGTERLDVSADLLKNDAELNDQISALKKNRQKAYEKENKEVIAVLEPQIKELEEKLTAHIKTLREKHPLFAATKYPEPMDLAQTALKENEWVLAYDVTDSGFLAYLLKGKTLVKGLLKPVPRKEVDDLVRKFREPLEMGAEDSMIEKAKTFDFASGKKLSDILLADILPDLPKGVPLIIIPDDSLGVLPFEMLVLNDGGKTLTDKKVPYVSGAEFFGDRNPISYYQSVTALTLARTLGKQQKPGEKALAMVDPVFSDGDPRVVQMAKEEKNKILASLPKDLLMSINTEIKMTFPRLPLTGQLGESLKKADPSRTDLYEGFKADKAILFKQDLAPYRSVIFATHGYFGKDLPGIQEPVLVLTLCNNKKDQDGFLRLSEVMGLKFNADIVALTACQTGIGHQISGEGTMGMGRAFQYAGAKSVLMSLWSVSETSSVKLVESFFKHLKEGKGKLESLRLARKEIRDAGYDHPFFWAPFILVGEVD